VQNPRRFTKELRASVGHHLVWLPGAPISVGTVVLQDNGIYKIIDHISERGVHFKVKPAKSLDIRFASKGVATATGQAGGQVTVKQLRGNAEASLRYTFQRENSFVLNAARCKGIQMARPLAVAQQIGALASIKWRYLKYFIVCRVYSAQSMVLLANRTRRSQVEFRGAAETLKGVFDGKVNSSVSYRKSGSMALEILGNEGGPIAMEVFRIRRTNGHVVID
jgi:hypothetical protein